MLNDDTMSSLMHIVHKVFSSRKVLRNNLVMTSRVDHRGYILSKHVT